MSTTTVRSGIGFVAIAFLLVALAGVTGNGPLGFLQRSSADSAGASASSAAPSNGKTTTTLSIQAIELRSYSKGDCVTWDQSHATDRQLSDVVPCERPHLVEIAGKIDMSGRFDHYPTEAEWDHIFASDCRPSAQSLLGAPLDPVGRFITGGLRPLTDAWNQGDRTVYCGVVTSPTRPGRRPGRFDPFQGKVEGASQTRTDAIGACVAKSGYAVKCTASHLFEVVGYVDLTGAVAKPPVETDDAAWNLLVGEKCTAAGRTYLGHAESGNERFGWLTISAASWAAGRRTVECTVARYDDNDKEIPVTTSLKN